MNNIEYGKLKKAIDDWDPIGLLSSCAPSDEYDIESLKIYSKIQNLKDISLIAQVIYDVFVEMFGKETFNKEFSECIEIAKGIL